MTKNWTEAALSENPAIAVLRRLGYAYVPPESLEAERETFKEPILAGRLRCTIERLNLNPHLTPDSVGRAVPRLPGRAAAAAGRVRSGRRHHSPATTQLQSAGGQMTNPTWEELEAHKVAVKGDAPWQRRLRLLQARWREEMGLHIGTQAGREGALGSRIEAGNAERCYSNFLTDTIREVVRATLEKEEKEPQGKLIKKQRLLEDLLSSQPMCFNLFGELQADLVAATTWARQLWPDRVDTVRLVEFEHSPGRRDERYLGNRTAFDVYLEHTVPGGGQGFIGIEAKYHEDLAEPPAEARARVFEVARESGVFAESSHEILAKPPLQQVWYDHLLALSMLQADKARWGDNGLFVFLHPAASEPSYRVVPEYQRHLKSHRTFQRMTLEECVGTLQCTVGAPWVQAFGRRYLGWGR